MNPCPRCRSTAIHTRDGLTTCLMCGETIRDEPSLIDKWVSNQTPERTTTTRVDGQILGARLAPIEAPAAVKDRVLAAIRAEAAR